MFSFNKILSLFFVSLAGFSSTSAAPSASRRQACIIPTPGNYSFESVALAGELVGVGQPDSDGFTLVLEKAPPQGNLGVWTLTNADQGGFNILDVDLDLDVK